jgi:hypothetical protein
MGQDKTESAEEVKRSATWFSREQVSYRFHWKKRPCAGRQINKLVFPVEPTGLLIDRIHDYHQ